MKWNDLKKKKKSFKFGTWKKRGETLFRANELYNILTNKVSMVTHTLTNGLFFIRCLFFIIMMIKFQIDLNRIDYFRFSFSFFLSCFLSHPGPKTLCGHMIEIHDSYIAIIIIMLTVWSDHCNIDVVVWFTDNCDIKYF